MSKARKVVNGLGYSANNLEVAGRFSGSRFDLKYLTNKEGLGAARQAIREGKTAVWQSMFARISDEASGAVFSANPGPGQMLVTINPQGQVMSFSTRLRSQVISLRWIKTSCLNSHRADAKLALV